MLESLRLRVLMKLLEKTWPISRNLEVEVADFQLLYLFLCGKLAHFVGSGECACLLVVTYGTNNRV